MITDLAHTAVCVPDVDAAVTWYCDVLGLTVLSPPYQMEGDAIERDMGELVPSPVAVKAAIVGVDETDRVIEIVEYPNSPLLCDDVTATRADLETKGVHFLVEGITDVAGVRTTWISDPWDNVLILIEKVRRPDRPYYRQF
jgi:catechol 2,3-dioxygenase-like lactoylglutathione lyase family enzyme